MARKKRLLSKSVLPEMSKKITVDSVILYNVLLIYFSIDPA